MIITWLCHNGCPYHVETSPLIYRANQWAGFYMTESSVMKELIIFFFLRKRERSMIMTLYTQGLGSSKTKVFEKI